MVGFDFKNSSGRRWLGSNTAGGVGSSIAAYCSSFTTSFVSSGATLCVVSGVGNDLVSNCSFPSRIVKSGLVWKPGCQIDQASVNQISNDHNTAI